MEASGDEEVSRLYALPPEDFVAARDAVAGRVAAAGDKAQAAAIRKLRKPNLAAWAVNRLAHRHGPDVRRLVELWDALAAAPDAATVGELGRDRKRLIAKLLALAEEDLAFSGHHSSAAMDKVARTLNSGAVGPDRERLLAGRLERELDPAGFAAWTGSGLPDPDEGARQRDIRSAEAAVEGAQADLERALRAAERADEAVERAAAAAATAQERVSEARRQHEEAVARLQGLAGR